MKIAVCIPPPVCDCYGHLTRYAEKIAEIGTSRGIEVETLRYMDPDFFARLFANLTDEECIVHFHSYLYDLKMNTSPAQPLVRHVLDMAKATSIATVSDHPFSDFMQDTVRNAHPKTRFMVIDKTFPDEMRYINPALEKSEFVYQPFVAPVSFDESRVTDYDSRPFDLVLPLLVVGLKEDAFQLAHEKVEGTWLERAMTATYEEAVTDLSKNPFHIFEEHMKAEAGCSFDDLRVHQPNAVPAVLNLLSTVDGVIRQERRNKMVHNLLRSVGKLKVAVLSPQVPNLEIDENVEFLGTQKAPEVAEIMANSRAVLNCNPTYPTNVHERVTVGMLYESCVITDLNPCIEENFSSDDIVPYSPSSPFSIRDIFADNDTREIAKGSAKKARQNPRFSWHSHFDALLEAARA